MPYYEYHCARNGRTVEVRHGMRERVETWGSLADRAGIEPGATPPTAPVERLMSSPAPPKGTSEQVSNEACGLGCACAPRP